MRIAVLLQAFALFLSVFTLLLSIGVRLLRKQDLDTFLKQQERERFQRRMAAKGEPDQTVTARSMGWAGQSARR